MSTELAATLPIAQRLALSYAPAASRESILTLMLLDQRLAGILRSRGEAIIAQMKLAWWRDRLGEDPQGWPAGEPLLERLRDWPVSPGKLLPLVDGWEVLLADEFLPAVLAEFARGRALAWRALAGAFRADRDRAEQAAFEWALADCALHLDDPQDAAAARRVALQEDWAAPRLPRALRPLAVLHGLSRRAMVRESAELLDGPAAGLLAIRVGVTGR